MSEMQGPNIESYSGPDFTSVEFVPDFKRFGMKGMSDDMVQLLKKRVYDMAGILKVKVILNGKEVKLRSFSQYVDMYLGEAAEQKITESEPRWKVVLVPQSDGQFQQVSFVNSICTYKGGSHVNYIMDQVTTAVLAALKKKHKDMEVKPAQVRSFFFLFLSCSIENPAFDSQTK
jgi:DNA topoisomerase-2